jgi:hypothetical protein
MKVKDVIKNMQDYNPEDEVVILWWTKDIFNYGDEADISDEVWSKVVKTLDDENNLDFANSVISDEILCELAKNEVNA